MKTDFKKLDEIYHLLCGREHELLHVHYPAHGHH